MLDRSEDIIRNQILMEQNMSLQEQINVMKLQLEEFSNRLDAYEKDRKADSIKNMIAIICSVIATLTAVVSCAIQFLPPR